MKKHVLGILLAAVLMLSLAAAASAITTVDLTLPEATKIPVIDGKFDPDEGWGDPIVPILTIDQMGDYLSDSMWEGDEEILPQSVTVYMRWDAEHLYFCSVIVDPIHFNDNEADDFGSAYAGDALQFDIKSMADDDTGNRNRYFYGVTNDGELCANNDKVEMDASAEISEPAWTACVVTRDEDTQTTVYETAFDMKANLPNSATLKAGDQLYVRDIVLCTQDEATEDIVDVNVPGMVNGDYAYWLVTCAAAEGGASGAADASDGQPVSTVYIPEKTVTVDGVIADGEWDGATRMKLNISDTSTWSENGAGIVGTDGWSKLGHTDDDFTTELAFTVNGDDLYILLTRKDSTLNFASDNYHRPYSSDCALMWFYNTDDCSQYGLQLLAADKSGNPIIGYFFMDSDQGTSDNLMELEYATAVTKATADSYVMEAKVNMSGMDDFGHDMLASGNVTVTWCAVNICEEGWDSDDGEHTLWGTYNYQAQYKGVNDWDYAPVAKLVPAGGASSEPASSEPASSEPASSGAELLNKSWDTIFVDYEMMVDGGAGAWLADNPVEGDIEQLETRGWAHISTPIKGFAYAIDGGEAVKSEDFIQDRPDVKSVIHEEAEGFDISIDVSGLDAGDHVIKVYAIDENDGLVDTTFDFPFTVSRAPAPAAGAGFASVKDAAAAAGMTPITGYEWEDGTNGFGNEGPENLWDGDTATKFCTNEFPAESVASLDGTYKVTGFTMATANDNADYNGRSPNAWTISVSADGESWTKLASGDDSFFEEKNFTYYNGEGKADNVAFVKFEAAGTASGTFQVSEVTLYGEKTGDKPAKAEPEPAPVEEPAPAEEPAAEEPAADTPAEAPADTPAEAAAPEAKKSGCGSFVGGGLIVLVTVLGSAWIARRK